MWPLAHSASLRGSGNKEYQEKLKTEIPVHAMPSNNGASALGGVLSRSTKPATLGMRVSEREALETEHLES
jgi:hypothetical protein